MPKMSKTSQNPPNHLTNPSKLWWSEVYSQYTFEAHHLKLLTLAAEALDQAERARVTLAKEGETVLDRYDVPKKHPAVSNERAAIYRYMALLKLLGINEDQEDKKPAGRPMEY